MIRTFYLSNWSTPTDIQDATNTLRTLLELPRVQQLQSSGAIVVRGTPAQIALAEKILNDIDKAKPEVVVEVAIMQVSRDKLRQLGIQKPFSTTANPTITLQSTNPLTRAPPVPPLVPRHRHHHTDQQRPDSQRPGES